MGGGYRGRIQTVSGELSVTETYVEAETCHIFMANCLFLSIYMIRHVVWLVSLSNDSLQQAQCCQRPGVDSESAD